MTVRGQALTTQVFGATHTGRIRAGNEDSYLVGDAVHAVADGMGGHQAGEIASDAALGPLRSLNVAALDPDDVGAALATAVREANTVVVERASADPDLEGMGTTLTAVAVVDGLLYVAHVGDSRAYLLRDEEPMSQLTTDHTLVERLVREGRLSRDEAASHPQRNVITRAIGHETTVDVEVLPPITLRDGDQILLCSDGLSGPVDDERIASILGDAVDGDRAVAALLAQANAAGGPDNITAVLIRVGDRWATGQTATNDPSPSTTQQLAAQPGPAKTAAASSSETAATQTTQPIADQRGAPPAEPGRRRARGDRSATRSTMPRVVTALLALALLALVGIGGGWLVVARSYFVGDHDGMVAIYRGVPQQFLGISANRVIPEEITTTPVADFPEFRQDALRGGVTAQSLRDAQLIVEDLQGQLREATDPPPTIGEPLAEPPSGP